MACIAAQDFRLPLCLALVTVTVAAAGCERGGTAAPGFVAAFDSVEPRQVLAYLKRLEFDERLGAGDEQPLLLGSCPKCQEETCPVCQVGPLVTLQPEQRSYRNKIRDLEGSPGRIIARLINRDQKREYPEFNLGPSDTVYWVVDHVQETKDSLYRYKGRSLFLSYQGLLGKRDKAALTRDLYIEEHPNHPWEQSLARFVTRTFGDVRVMGTWGNCGSGTCCHAMVYGF
jgi:hypothetical protein